MAEGAKPGDGSSLLVAIESKAFEPEAEVEECTRMGASLSRDKVKITRTKNCPRLVPALTVPKWQ